jgi:hypothetical protein
MDERIKQQGDHMRVEIMASKGHPKSMQGSTIVELAMVLPLFVLLLFGIIEFGRYFFVQHTMQFATREGTRLALVGSTLGARTRAESIVQMIQDNVRLAINPSEISISIFPITASYSDPTGWEQQQNAGGPGDYMRVRTRHNYRFLTPLLAGFFNGGSVTIQAEATYRNELF